jgi:hypothetical protein
VSRPTQSRKSQPPLSSTSIGAGRRGWWWEPEEEPFSVQRALSVVEERNAEGRGGGKETDRVLGAPCCGACGRQTAQIPLLRLRLADRSLLFLPPTIMPGRRVRCHAALVHPPPRRDVAPPSNAFQPPVTVALFRAGARRAVEPLQ